MNLRGLIHHLVGKNPNGRTLLLEAFNFGREKNKMSEQMLNNKLNHNNTTHNINADEVELIADKLDINLPIAEHFANKANAVVFVLPDVGESDMAILDGYLNITTELGDVGVKFQQAYADGNIDKADAEAIKKETDEAIAAILAFQKRIEGMVR